MKSRKTDEGLSGRERYRSPIKIAVIGATGYTGIELFRILFHHSGVSVTLVTSEKYAGKRLDQVFPFLTGKTDLVLEPLSDAQVSKKCDLAFCCLPHKSAMTHIPLWLHQKVKVVDLSADFRFQSASVYEKWYEKHTAPQLLKNTVYGLPELYRNKIKKASLVGNPGCYPTGAILALAPLLKEKLITGNHIIIDSKSGATGAGRSAVIESLFCEVNESIHAYKVGKHRHTPEIEQALSDVSGQDIVVSFTPHLVPMDRGILSTIYATAVRGATTKMLLKALSNFYKKEPFVTILPEDILPKTKDVRGTNHCLIGAVFDSRTQNIVLVAVIDNLMKGASGQAVQNMNIMYGLDETTGLKSLPLFP